MSRGQGFGQSPASGFTRNSVVQPSLTLPPIPRELFTPYVPTEYFHKDEWIWHLTGGYVEEQLRSAPASFIEKIGDKTDYVQGRAFPHLQIKNYTTNVPVDSGALAHVALGDLYAELDRRIASGEKAQYGEKDCTMIFITRGDDASIGYVDVAAQQASGANARAMFQCASNFNGVEATQEIYAPNTPNIVSFYVYNRTQGPTAAVSAGGAAITRCLAPFYDENTDPAAWGQTETRQLESLGELGRYFTVQNGYVVNNGSEAIIPPATSADFRRELNKVKVMAHLDAEVTSASRSGDYIGCVGDKHVVSQVMCATMNVGQGNAGYTNAQLPGAMDKIEFLLRAAYEGAYAAAICNGCDQLYLTLIGGGALGNDINVIHKVIGETHAKFVKTHNTSLRRVYLPYFGQPAQPAFDNLKQTLTRQGLPYMWYHCQNGASSIVEEQS